jgi:hypothetical protein
VKFVEWKEVVDWSWGLAKKIDGSGFVPHVIVAVGRGGLCLSRLLCDFLDVESALAFPIKWVKTVKRHGEKYLADLVRGWVEAVKEGKAVEQSVADVVKVLKARITFEFDVNLSDQRVLLVEEIVATGMHMSRAKEYVSRRWRAGEIRTATLVWKSSTAPLFKPDYYLVEPGGFVWFQFPWSRLGDYKQFLRAMLSNFAKEGKRMCGIEDVKKGFAAWFGKKYDLTYLNRALQLLARENTVKFLDDRTLELSVP